MSPKEFPGKSKKSFTGFIAYYEHGKTVKERENYFSKKLNKECATNWCEIDKNKLIALELVWRGSSKVKIDKVPSDKSHHPLSPEDWFFSQNGYFDLGSKSITVVARNIGYKENGIIAIFKVEEENGIIQISSRAA